jgi:formamidopyrimidine-DNA glycosylase
MPELPDIVVYIEALERRIVGQRIERILLKNPFLLRSVEPPLGACEGQRIVALRRIGKRIAIGLANDVWLVLHLMIAGRLHWYERDSRQRKRPSLLTLELANGALTLTEAGTKRRASLHLVQGEQALQEFDRGGLEVLDSDAATFRARLEARNHTLKRALTDPTILSGIGQCVLR